MCTPASVIRRHPYTSDSKFCIWFQFRLHKNWNWFQKNKLKVIESNLKCIPIFNKPTLFEGKINRANVKFTGNEIVFTIQQ